MTTTRLMSPEDAPVLAALLRSNRDFLAPWEPDREDSYFTEEGQLAVVRDALDWYEAGTHVPHVIVDDDGRVVGRITLSGIVRFSLQSASVGYWVSEHANGRGHATAALRSMIAVAFGDLGLHRIQAETLKHNAASQRILERAGFERYGLAPEYLRIAGRWQDCVMYQLINRDMA
ncbi:N-acetyltransferase [Bailinhaonella thermotolerans]|uniref:N-acetyltransferase n=1 Tax=Bailinhaonella thermotolerans TaxID=1070861 RepID=A0A3A4ASM3_9ACTN|nr:GNAT family protein [Bailinhaonella thermotolerans]RJL32908.1 N-acetyltransferase [Bailinhaonella thermotolerans]